jgi:DNA-binding transcriptional ArsR family regulator
VGTELLDATFAALADPTRRAILARLADYRGHWEESYQRLDAVLDDLLNGDTP